MGEKVKGGDREWEKESESGGRKGYWGRERGKDSGFKEREKNERERGERRGECGIKM